MTLSRAAFLESFAATAAERGEPSPTASAVSPESWLQALVLAYIRVHGLAVDPRRLALFEPPWSTAAPVPDRAHAPWDDVLATAGVDILGQAREALLAMGHRRARGVFYTPSDVADALVALVLGGSPTVGTDGGDAVIPAVLDPAVGGGAFLVAAAARLEACGWSRRTIVEQGLWGIDIDPLAVAVTDAVLRCWAAGAAESADRQPVRTNLAVGDTLRHGSLVFERAPAEGFDAVVGNPPFQNQLSATTARARAETVELRPWLGNAAYRYADTATVFLAAALRLARPGGRAGLILPQSFLVADDAAGVRDELVATAVLEHLWVAPEPIFAAQVRVCAPVAQRRAGDTRNPTGSHEAPAIARAGRGSGSPQRWRGRDFVAMGPSPIDVAALDRGSTWAPLVADLFGLPSVTLRSSGSDRVAARLADICSATAGFRDQYYGLVPHVRDATEQERDALGAPASSGSSIAALAPLLTCGLIGPVWSDWGRRPTKFAKRTWQAPVVALDTLERDDPALHRWTMARRVPKLIVATQTRVIEAVVDEEGRWYPSVPSIALACAPEQLWRVAAVVMAPVITLWAFHRHVGAALSADALKVSARQLLAAPLPLDGPAWDCAARHLRVAHRCALEADTRGWLLALEHFAGASAASYQLPDADAEVVSAWWLARLPDVAFVARSTRGAPGAAVPTLPAGLVSAGNQTRSRPDPDEMRRP